MSNLDKRIKKDIMQRHAEAFEDMMRKFRELNERLKKYQLDVNTNYLSSDNQIKINE